ncbi:hypothetical protein vBBcePLY3_00041 [Bacillus phage vB_BceP_LY3]|uniref:Uncharacterized protein n=1 Tax=Bacillus phage vB_BceP_LY3 TaxID=2950458 RepID=A0AAE9LV88_9CAUD|nr:hypothetical protein vBBcePLY3_00041 [Bacillus phage vB_BceP_LY3]
MKFKVYMTSRYTGQKFDKVFINENKYITFISVMNMKVDRIEILEPNKR